ncbi:unnamed protein product [Malus baccata var. baccata]
MKGSVEEKVMDRQKYSLLAIESSSTSEMKKIATDFLSRVWIESKKLWHIVGPDIINRLAGYSMTVITQAFAGHLGDVELASISMANNIIVGFGYGLLLGMASALATLCGQTFGAKRYHMLGIYMQRSWIVLFSCCILLLPVYLYASPILKLIGQSDEVAEQSGALALWLIPLHFSYAFQFPLQRFLQCQLKNFVTLWVSLAVLVLHSVTTWILVSVLDFGVVGAAIALDISCWACGLGLFWYVVSGGCPLSWVGFSIQAFSGIWEFAKYSAASGVLLLEFWSYRILILMTGFLEEATLAVDAFTTINVWDLMIHLAFLVGTAYVPYLSSLSVIVRVANELGSGNGKAAKFAQQVSMAQSASIGLCLCVLVIMFHHKFAHVFTSSPDVIEAVDQMSYLLAVTVVLNSVQSVLAGVVVGSGWQAWVAYISLFSYYIFGLPLAFVMGSALHFGVSGIWGGMIFGGTAVQTAILAIVTIRHDWEMESRLFFNFTLPTKQPTEQEVICMMGIVDREEEVHLHQSLLAESSSKNTTTTDDDQQNTHLWSRVWIESKKLWRVVGPAIIGRLSAFSMIVITQAFAGHLGVVELASISIANNVIVGFTFGLLFDFTESAVYLKCDFGEGGLILTINVDLHFIRCRTFNPHQILNRGGVGWGGEGRLSQTRRTACGVGRGGGLGFHGLGMASALETLCGQAFGAKRHHMLGIYLQRSWIVLFLCCILLLPIYIFASPILKLLGQSDDVAEMTGVVSLWLLPMHFSYAFLFPLQRFLQSQLKNFVTLWVALVVLVFHALISWLFVYVLDFGVVGAAIALDISWWVSFFVLLGYVTCGWCPLSWTGFSMEAISGLWEFVKLSTASGLGILVLQNLDIDDWTLTERDSFCGRLINLHDYECLGAHDSFSLLRWNWAAKFAAEVSVAESSLIALFFCILIIAFRDNFGYIFTTNSDVIQRVNQMSYILGITILLNGVQPVLSGVAVGSGWQAWVAYINLFCYYIIGLPLGFVMGWVADLGVTGIWGGMILGGTAVQTVILGIVTSRRDWEKEAQKASQRVNKWSTPNPDDQTEEQQYT